jgi:hypothetical protein
VDNDTDKGCEELTGKVADVGMSCCICWLFDEIGRVHVGQKGLGLGACVSECSDMVKGVQSGVITFGAAVPVGGGIPVLGCIEALSAVYSRSPRAMTARSIASSANDLVPSNGVRGISFSRGIAEVSADPAFVLVGNG